MHLKDIPNILTIGRMILVVPIVLLLINQLFKEALLLFFVAGVSDGLDGFLAKRYCWSSKLGAVLDPLADKFLLSAVYLSSWYIDILPWWLVSAVIIRDIIIIGGAMFYRKRIQKITMSPSIVSKINTFLQILLILIIMVNNIVVIFSEEWLQSLFYIVLTTTVLSGTDYVWTWGLRLKNNVDQY